MDKKIVISILFGFIFLFGLFGLTKNASGSIDTTNTAIVFYGGTNVTFNDTVAEGGREILVNMTVAVNSNDGTANYTGITVSWSTANFTFVKFLTINDEDTAIEATNGSDETYTSNVTFWAADGSPTPASWNATNVSLGSIRVLNQTTQDILGINSSNDKLLIKFVLLSASNAESLDLINVTIDNASESVTQNLEVFVDGLPPRFQVINITDGNTTYFNESSSPNFPLNGEAREAGGNFFHHLNANGSLTVNVEVQELLPETDGIKIYYNASHALITNASIDGSETKSGVMTQNSVPGLTRSGMYSFTIPKSELIMNGFLTFVFSGNDSLDQPLGVNNSYTTGTARAPFVVATNTSSMNFNQVNITSGDGTGVITVLKSGSDQLTGSNYLPDNSFDMWIEVENATGDKFGLADVYMLYSTIETVVANNTDYGNNIHQRFGGQEGEAFFANKFSESATKTIFNITDFPLVGNDTKTFSFALVANNSYNYTVFAEYRFKVDGAAPTEPTLTVPSSRYVTVGDSAGIAYSCSSDDAGSGVDNYDWELTKPGGEVVLKENTKDVTWSGSNIDKAGEYSVKCTAKDNVGHKRSYTATSSETFTANYDTVVASSGGGGGGSAATPTVSFDVDFSVATVGNIKAQQGLIKTFSFDGDTKHTITFDKVTATSATVTIASTPITVTLDVGKAKEIDINGDGVNDMKVTLKGVVNGLADVQIEKIEAGAQAVVKEEKAAAGVTEPQPTTTPEDVIPTPVERSNTGLWITALVILAVVVIGYLSYRKK